MVIGLGNKHINDFLSKCDLGMQGVYKEQEMIISFKEGSIVDEFRVHNIMNRLPAEINKKENDIDINLSPIITFTGGEDLIFKDESGTPKIFSTDEEYVCGFERYLKQNKIFENISPQQKKTP